MRGNFAEDKGELAFRRDEAREARAHTHQEGGVRESERPVQRDAGLCGTDAALPREVLRWRPDGCCNDARERVGIHVRGRWRRHDESLERIWIPCAEGTGGVIRAEHGNAVEKKRRLVRGPTADVHPTRRLGPDHDAATARGEERIRLGQERVVSHGGHGHGSVHGVRRRTVVQPADRNGWAHVHGAKVKRGPLEGDVDRHFTQSRHDRVEHARRETEAPNTDVLRSGGDVAHHIAAAGVGDRNAVEVGENDLRAGDGRTARGVGDRADDAGTRGLQDNEQLYRAEPEAHVDPRRCWLEGDSTGPRGGPAIPADPAVSQTNGATGSSCSNSQARPSPPCAEEVVMRNHTRLVPIHLAGAALIAIASGCADGTPTSPARAMPNAVSRAQAILPAFPGAG